MIRVLHVFGALNRGGAESRTMDLYRAINRQVIQFDFMVHTQAPGAFDEEVQALGGQIHYMPRYKIYNHYSYRQGWRDFLKEHPEYQDVHIHTINVAGAILPELVKANIPMRIVHARSSSNASVVKRIVLAKSRRTINRQSTLRLAVSRKAAGYVFGSHEVASGNAKVIPDAINIDTFRFNADIRQQVRKELGIEGALVLGQVGRFEPVKNHAYTLRIFEEVLSKNENAILVLVGNGPLYQRVKSQAIRRGIIDHVMFLGLRHDVPALMQGFDKLLLPSLFEGLPGVILEAQAAGLPCLIADTVTEECAVIPELCTFLSIKKVRVQSGQAHAWWRTQRTGHVPTRK